MYSQFEERGVRVAMIAQEDESQEQFWKLVDTLEGDVPFDLATDISRSETSRYDRVTTYLMDAEGRVLEIFPLHRRMTLSWDAVLHRIDELRR